MALEYDGQVVGVIDGEIGNPHKGRIDLSFYNSTFPEGYPIDFAIFRAQKLLKFSPNAQGPAFDDMREILALHDAKVTEVIFDGRIHMTVLLNSPGGSGLIASWINQGLRHIQNGGGVTRVYGLREVSSAATHIWQEATERFMLTDTHSVWHTHSLAGGGFDEQQREIDRQKLIQFFSQLPSSEAQQQIIRQLKESPQGEVEFSGAELESLGVAQQAFSSIEAMTEHIIFHTGMRIDIAGIFKNLSET